MRGETGTRMVPKMVPKMVPIMVPKVPEISEISETLQGISSDIVPNGYKGFGVNPRQ